MIVAVLVVAAVAVGVHLAGGDIMHALRALHGR